VTRSLLVALGVVMALLTGPASTVAHATGPTLTLSPGSFNYGTITTNQRVAFGTFTLQNVPFSNGSSIGINSMGSTPPFFISGTSCGTVLALGQSCSITVEFRPSTLGSYSGSLIITDNISSVAITAPLSGRYVFVPPPPPCRPRICL
jgi:hypothetical protein